MPVQPDEIISLFLTLTPEFQPVWDDYLSWWDKRPRGRHDDMAIFARFLVDAFTNGKTERFPQIFHAVEDFVSSEDQTVRELATLGILEGMQIISSNRHMDLDAWLKWLEPASKQAWNSILKLRQGE